MTNPPPDFVLLDLSKHPYRVRQFYGKTWLCCWHLCGYWVPISKLSEVEVLHHFAMAIPLDQARDFEAGLPFLCN